MKKKLDSIKIDLYGITYLLLELKERIEEMEEKINDKSNTNNK